MKAHRKTSRRTDLRAATSGMVRPASEWPTTTTSVSKRGSAVHHHVGAGIAAGGRVIARKIRGDDHVTALRCNIVLSSHPG